MRKKNTGTHQPATPATPAAKARVTRPAEHSLAQKHTKPAEPKQPTSEQIAQLAYSFWEGRGYQGGSPEEDWFRAQRELLATVE